MIIRLKTLDELEEEFRDRSTRWFLFKGDLHIDIDSYEWIITKNMKKFFGTKVKVEKHNPIHDSSYTHVSKLDSKNSIVYGLHESWFVTDEFLKEEDVMI